MNTKMAVFLLVAFGSFFALIREAVIAYYFGVSQEADFFRVAYTIPNYFVQTLGTILVSSMVGYSTKYQTNQPLIYQAKVTLVFWLYVLALLGFLSIEYQVAYFYPGYTGQSKELAGPMLLGWLMFAIATITFFRRAELTISKIRWPSSSVQLIRAGGWVVVFVVLRKLGVVNLYAALYAAIITSIFLLITHFFVTKPSMLPSDTAVVRSFDKKECLKFSYLFGGVLLYQVLASSSRFIDRYYSSLLGEGSLSSIEFSHGLVLAISGFLLTSLTIIYLPRVVSLYYSANGKVGGIMEYSAILLIAVTILPFLIPKDWASNLISLVFKRGSFGDEAFLSTSYYFGWHFKGLGLLFVSALLSHFLIAINKQAMLLIFVTIKFSVKLVFMAFFFDAMKREALVESFMYSEIVYFILVGFYIYRLFKIKNHLGRS
jgi:putative peptidoglycan lipid II flippase